MSSTVPISSLHKLPAPGDSKKSEKTATSAGSPAKAGADSVSIAELVRKEVAAALKSALPEVIAALPKPTPAPKPKATPARGLLAQLGVNAGVARGARDDDEVEDISDDDPEADADDGALAPLARVNARAPKNSESKSGSALRARVAAGVLEQVKPYGTVLAWVRFANWNVSRNKFECEAIAQAVDALLSEGVQASSDGIEILLRRLTGVHLADSSGAWAVADAVAWEAHGGSLLPRKFVSAAYKDAEVLKRAQSALAPTPKSAFGGSGSGAGGGAQKSFRYSKNGKSAPPRAHPQPTPEPKGAAPGK